MKHQLLEDLIAYLSDPEHGSEDERTRLLAEVQAERYGRPYQSRIHYRLERHYTTDEKEEDGKIVPHPHIVNVGGHTVSLLQMRKRVEWAIATYGLEELRLYHGPHRIRDIEGWLAEQEVKNQESERNNDE